MRNYTIIFFIVLGIHFLIKAFTYSDYIKTNGIVVSWGEFRYGPIKSSGAIVRYPIAEFRDVENHEKQENISLEKIVAAIKWDSVSKYNIKYVLLEKEKELKEQQKKRLGIYLTKEPTGSYFFHKYETGEKIGIIYRKGHPNEAIVYSFFSYWLTLPALMLLMVTSTAIAGLHTFAKIMTEQEIRFNERIKG